MQLQVCFTARCCGSSLRFHPERASAGLSIERPAESQSAPPSSFYPPTIGSLALCSIVGFFRKQGQMEAKCFEGSDGRIKKIHLHWPDQQPAEERRAQSVTSLSTPVCLCVACVFILGLLVRHCVHSRLRALLVFSFFLYTCFEVYMRLFVVFPQSLMWSMNWTDEPDAIMRFSWGWKKKKNNQQQQRNSSNIVL